MAFSETASQKIKWNAKSNPDGYLLCPLCGKKTKTKVRPETLLFHSPLYCTWCKRETLINRSPDRENS